MREEHLVLREAILSDAPRIAEIYLNSRAAFVGFAPLKYSDLEVENWVKNELISKTKVMVASVDEKLVGMIGLAERDGFGWIDHLYLEPAEVNKGIGTRLVKWGMSELPHPIRLFTFQENTLSRRFYERLGFRAIGYTDGAENEEGCPDVLYEYGGIERFVDSGKIIDKD